MRRVVTAWRVVRGWVLRAAGQAGDAALRLHASDLRNQIRLLQQDVAERDATLAIRRREIEELSEVVTRNYARVEMETAIAVSLTAQQGLPRRPQGGLS